MATNEGFIVLHRKIMQWEWYDNVNVFHLFVHLILLANHEDRKWHGILVKRGSHITSYANLAFETGLSVQQVRTSINKLKSTHELTYLSTREYSILTINNYGRYQDINKQPNKRVTNLQQTSNNKQQLYNDNNDNKRESTLSKRYSSKEEIGEETLVEISKSYLVPLAFVKDCWDTAQNWLLAKGKVQKNYKAFLSNWVKREKASQELKGRKFYKEISKEDKKQYVEVDVDTEKLDALRQSLLEKKIIQ
jgi:hypothetical protein